MEIKFIEKNISRHSYAELTELFNKRFGLAQTVDAIIYAAVSRGLFRSVTHDYSPAERMFLETIIPGRSVAEITKLFNKSFGLSIPERKISAFMKNHKLRTGRDSRFRPGHVPHNTGKKGCITVRRANSNREIDL